MAANTQACRTNVGSASCKGYVYGPPSAASGDTANVYCCPTFGGNIICESDFSGSVTACPDGEKGIPITSGDSSAGKKNLNEALLKAAVVGAVWGLGA